MKCKSKNTFFLLTFSIEIYSPQPCTSLKRRFTKTEKNPSLYPFQKHKRVPSSSTSAQQSMLWFASVSSTEAYHSIAEKNYSSRKHEKKGEKLKKKQDERELGLARCAQLLTEKRVGKVQLANARKDSPVRRSYRAVVYSGVGTSAASERSYR